MQAPRCFGCPLKSACRAWQQSPEGLEQRVLADAADGAAAARSLESAPPRPPPSPSPSPSPSLPSPRPVTFYPLKAPRKQPKEESLAVCVVSAACRPIGGGGSRLSEENDGHGHGNDVSDEGNEGNEGDDEQKVGEGRYPYYLLQKRPSSGLLAGQWEFITGKDAMRVPPP
jgi:adenine-specific DNA glycosylase